MIPDNADPNTGNGASEAQAWRRKAVARSRRALSGAAAGADRLALLRSLVRLNDGRLDLDEQGLRLDESDRGQLHRFGLAADGAVLRSAPSDFELTVSGLRDGLDLDSRPRQVFQPASPDAILLRLTPYRSYRSVAQKSGVRALVSMPDGAGLMVSMPTGSGKSLLFHVAALQARREHAGACVIVITPTVALALDHERTSRAIAGLEGSLALTGDLKGPARQAALFSFRRGEIPLLFLSPEQLFSADVQQAAHEAVAASGAKPVDLKARLAALVVDEAHIIEQWGRNFRPDFQRLPGILHSLRRVDPSLRSVFLSATLPRAAKAEIRRAFAGPERPWLEVDARAPRYEFDIAVQRYVDPAARADALDQVVDLAPRPAVIYTTLVEEADALYRHLAGPRGYRRIALFTGAVSDPAARRQILARWAADELDLVVATSAFGLGVDKDDVRSVIHACLPENPTRWYQEIGRGGRDGHQALAACLFTDFPRGPHALSDVRNAYGQSTRSWLGRIKAAGRWAALYEQSSARHWQGPRLRMTLDLDAVRDGLANRSSDYNRAWNRALLTLMQRAEVLEVVSTNGEDTAAGATWVVDVVDHRLLDGDPAVWSHIGAVRDAERRASHAELEEFVQLMRAPDRQCLTRSVFEAIEGGETLAEPCGRCPSCRARALSPPTVIPCAGLEAAWSYPLPSARAHLPAGVTLLAARDAEFETGLAPLGRRLVGAGVEQIILSAAERPAMLSAFLDADARFGFVLTHEEWSGPVAGLACTTTAVLLPQPEPLALRTLARVETLARAWPEQSLIVVGRPDRVLDGRRLDQVSPRAPVAEVMLDDLARERGVAI
jgi:ATP-dependent DNA helicase RecQ